MPDLELELTYLAKYVPEDLYTHHSKEIIDLYIPKGAPHPRLRFRKNGDTYAITKKQPVSDDASMHHEHTITIDKDEFDAMAGFDVRQLRKNRYYYPYKDMTAEIDVFEDDLSGLVLVDFEFDSVEAMRAFEMPDFCLADITQDEFIAGGVLSGMSYQDIEEQLDQYSYKPLR